MTVTYDPRHPSYYDSTDLHLEQERVFDLCHGCRLCWNICPSFESLFQLIDNDHNDDPRSLTHLEHKRVVDECYQCKLCYVKCPYIPPHEWKLDFPRLMMRSLAVQAKETGVGLTEKFLANTDLIGKLGTATAPIANLANHSTLFRDILDKSIGVAKDRLLPDFSHERFSVWFKKWNKSGTPPSELNIDGSGVTLFPTCLVEYQQPAIGKDAVRVLERNGVAANLAEGSVCCGMPWLDAGDVTKFLQAAEKNVEILNKAVASGNQIVVLQPTCGYVLKKEYPDYLQSDAARNVADHTADISEYLVSLRKIGKLSTEFAGEVFGTIAWHIACHTRAQNIGFKGRDLMRLTGAKVQIIEGCSGIDGTWGYRKKNYSLAKKVIKTLTNNLGKVRADIVVGDCHLANTAITEETGLRPVHPVQILARAYGISEEN